MNTYKITYNPNPMAMDSDVDTVVTEYIEAESTDVALSGAVMFKNISGSIIKAFGEFIKLEKVNS